MIGSSIDVPNPKAGNGSDWLLRRRVALPATAYMAALFQIFHHARLGRLAE